MRVRVIDDEPFIAELLAVNVQIAGHTVDVHHSAADLLDPALWRDVDVVLTDLSMPDLDGDELCEWLADNAPHVRRVVLTASGRDLSTVHAHATLEKPIQMEALFAALAGDAA